MSPRAPDAVAHPVLHALLAQGAFERTRAHVAAAAGVSEKTISNVVGDLAAARYVCRGRPARLGPALGLALSFSLGTESLRASLVDPNGAVLHALEDEPLAGQLAASPAALLSRIRALGVRVLDAALGDEALWTGAQPRLRLLGIAIAWPAAIDRSGQPNRLTFSDGGWRRPDREGRPVPTLAERVAATFGPPFDVERCCNLNDVNANALAIVFQQTRARALEEDDSDDERRVAIVVRVGGGLGAAAAHVAPHRRGRLAFVDSRLIVGSNRVAGEIGHMRVERSVIEERNRDRPFKRLARLDYDRCECSCGALHHLEAFASGVALARRLEASGYVAEHPDGDITRRLRSLIGDEPDPLQAHALQDVGRILGRALAAPVLMLDPATVTLTGALAVPQVVGGVELERPVWHGTRSAVGAVGHDPRPFVGVQGAGLLLMRRSVYRGFLDRGAWDTPPIDFGPDDLERLSAGRSRRSGSGRCRSTDRSRTA